MKLEITLPDGLEIVRIEAVPNQDAERRIGSLERLLTLVEDQQDRHTRAIADAQTAVTDIRAEIKGGPFRNVSDQ